MSINRSLVMHVVYAMQICNAYYACGIVVLWYCGIVVCVVCVVLWYCGILTGCISVNNLNTSHRNIIEEI